MHPRQNRFITCSLTPSAWPVGLADTAAGHVCFLGAGMAIAMPILYSVIGFVTGVVGAAIYNVISKWVGGIEVEVE